MQINQHLSHASVIMTGGEYMVQLDPMRELKTGATRNEIAIVITALRGKKRAYVDLSSGEKKRIDLAIQLALSRLVRTNVIVCDEVDQALDQAGQAAMVELLSEFAVERAVYVTSHNPYLRSVIASRRVVERRGGLSVLRDAA